LDKWILTPRWAQSPHTCSTFRTKLLDETIIRDDTTAGAELHPISLGLSVGYVTLTDLETLTNVTGVNSKRDENDTLESP
jgi:hypothetical protein